MTQQKKAIIIGSGFGGLATAIRLQAKGFLVTILEKSNQPGGHAQQYSENGYIFDMGPSIVTEPRIIESVFNSANKKMSDYIQFMLLDPFYRVYFHDGTYLDYTNDKEKMKTQLAKLNEQDSQNFDKFMEFSKKMYAEVITNGLGRQPFLSMMDMVRFAPFALANKAYLSAHSVTAQYFKDFRARFLFSFHALFIGGSPFNSPSVFLMLPYLEQSEGVWFSKGGMFSLVKAFEKLFLELGGKIIYNTEVSKINIEQGLVKSVTAGNSTYECDLCVSNSHFANTYLDLIDPVHRKKWTDKKVKSMDYSMGCVLLYLGVRKKYEKLLHHTLVISKDYKKLVDELFSNEKMPDDFSMYIHAPSISDSSLAPEGCESIYVLIPTPNLKAPINWETQRELFATKILNFLEKDFGLHDLNANLEVLKIFTPKDFEKDRNNYLGAPWSLQPKLTQIAYFRPHNKSEDINNLYIVGASTHPGGGVPGVLLGAEATTSVIFKDYEIN